MKVVEKELFGLDTAHSEKITPLGVKKSRGVADNQMIKTTEGENTRFIRHAMKSYGLPPIDIRNAEEVEERLKWYFNECGKEDLKPTVNGMARALGVHRDTLNSWLRGHTRKDTHSDVLKNAYALLEELWEQYMINGKINPVAGIFLGKNYFGYQDKQEIQVTATSTENDIDVESVRKKYLENEIIDANFTELENE